MQLLSFCRISELPVLFSLLPDLRNRGGWMSNDKKALDIGVFEPFDQEYRATQVHLVERL